MVLECLVFLGEIISPSKGALIWALFSSPRACAGVKESCLGLAG
jgi:hypothetical protein